MIKLKVEDPLAIRAGRSRWRMICRVLGSVLAAFLLRGSATAQVPKVVELTANDSSQYSDFGNTVAISGTTLAVGAGTTNGYTGSVYIFGYVNGAWVQQAKLAASDAVQGALFGQAIALSGNTLVVGARGSDETYIFSGAGTTWTQKAILRGSDTVGGDNFGISVAVSANGNTVAVGASTKQNYAGAAYVFARNTSGVWSQQAELIGNTYPAQAEFGAVSLAGNLLAIGAPYESQTGAAYLYQYTGGRWLQITHLVPPDAKPGDMFGGAVALNSNTLVATAPLRNSGAGAAYIYAPYAGTWYEQEILTSTDPQPTEEFGYSCSLSGYVVAIGCFGYPTVPGAAYLFDATGSGIWKLRSKDMVIGDQFGYSICVSGSTLAVGAPRKDGYTGAVYITP